MRTFDSNAQAPAAVAAIEDSFRLLVASVKDYAIFMLDLEGHVVSWNAGAERIKGYAAHEIIGRHFSVFYPTVNVEAGRPDQLLRTAISEGRAEDEGWRVRKNGSRFWASVVITALRDGKGTLLGFAKITRDLTERRRAEQALRESEERFARVLRSSPIAICLITAATGRLVDANPRFAELLGYQHARPPRGVDVRDLGLWADPGEYQRLTDNLRARHSIREAEVQYRTREGAARRALAVLEWLSAEGEDCILALFWRA